MLSVKLTRDFLLQLGSCLENHSRIPPFKGDTSFCASWEILPTAMGDGPLEATRSGLGLVFTPLHDSELWILVQHFTKFDVQVVGIN